MHGLMGDRFLKWFVGSLLSRPELPSTTEVASGINEDQRVSGGSDGAEKDMALGKEEQENTKKTDDRTKPGVSNQAADVTRSHSRVRETK